MKMKIKKGDTVQVIKGADKGTRGEVIKVIPQKGRLVVQGVNIQKKHHRQQQQQDQGRGTSGIKELEGPIDASCVMLICPQTDLPTRVGIKIDEDGVHHRVSKRSGEYID
jgi:large subunit ribosomal protein L24